MRLTVFIQDTFRFLYCSNKWCFAERSRMQPWRVCVVPQVCRDVKWKEECMDERSDDVAKSLLWKHRTEPGNWWDEAGQRKYCLPGPFWHPRHLCSFYLYSFRVSLDSFSWRKKLLPWLPTQESQNTFFWSIAPKLWSPAAFPFLVLMLRPLRLSPPAYPFDSFSGPLAEAPRGEEREHKHRQVL